MRTCDEKLLEFTYNVKKKRMRGREDIKLYLILCKGLILPINILYSRNFLHLLLIIITNCF